MVSFHWEGVDWNNDTTKLGVYKVSLLPLGRSGLKYMAVLYYPFSYSSPSTGKEWIEILYGDTEEQNIDVSFHWEGVDWNSVFQSLPDCRQRLLPLGRSGLKCFDSPVWTHLERLLPLGRSGLKCIYHKNHHSLWTVSFHWEGVDWNVSTVTGSGFWMVSFHWEGVDWNVLIPLSHGITSTSPSTGKEWIEIQATTYLCQSKHVSFHWEGVDWNSNHIRYCYRCIDVSFHWEGVDWNRHLTFKICSRTMSPSTGKEWIEMQ